MRVVRVALHLRAAAAAYVLLCVCYGGRDGGREGERIFLFTPMPPPSSSSFSSASTTLIWYSRLASASTERLLPHNGKFRWPVSAAAFCLERDSLSLGWIVNAGLRVCV